MKIPIILNYNPSNGTHEFTSVRIPAGIWTFLCDNIINSIVDLIVNGEVQISVLDNAQVHGPCNIKPVFRNIGTETSISIYAIEA